MQKTATRIESERLNVDRRSVDHGRLEIWSWSSGHHALHAGQRFAPCEVIHGFSALAWVESPTRHSVQVSENEHILLEPTYLQYTNHGCAPNVSLDVLRMEMVALMPIEAGEELLFFYPSTEWAMSQPFQCHCRARGCLGEIRGAACLPAHLDLGIPLSAHIKNLLARRCSATVTTTASTA